MGNFINKKTSPDAIYNFWIYSKQTGILTMELSQITCALEITLLRAFCN
jgi:hypothetical protein